MPISTPQVPQRDTEAYSSWLGGMDSGREASLIRPDQVSELVNATVRGGLLSTRPGFIWKNWRFGNEAICWRDFVETARFQGASYYSDESGGEYIIAVYGGRVFRLNPITRDINYIQISGDVRMSADVERCYFCRHSRFLIIQDGVSQPVIIEGGSARLADADKFEVPTGTIMASGQGYLIVASKDRLSFKASDHEYLELSGLNPGASPITFTYGQDYLYAGDRFLPPANHGKITGMVFIPFIDANAGDGRLIVFCERGITSWNLSAERSKWLTTDLSSIILQGFGATGPWSNIAINADIFYRSEDGVRSLGTARRNYGDPDNTPLSREVEKWLEQSTSWLEYYSSAAHFDQRLLVAVCPEIFKQSSQNRLRSVSSCQNEYAGEERIETRCKGILALNFHTLGGMNEKSAAVWDGLWTGIYPQAFVTGYFNGKLRCYCFSRDDDGISRMYEVSRNEAADITDGGYGSEKTKDIEARAVMRSFDFGNTMAKKSITKSWMNVMYFTGSLKWKTSHYPDGYYLDVPWQCGQETAQSCMQITSDCKIKPSLKQARLKLATGSDDCPRDCAESTGETLSRFYQTQPVFAWSGSASFETFMLQCNKIDDDRPYKCRTDTTGTLLSGCVYNDFQYKTNTL